MHYRQLRRNDVQIYATAIPLARIIRLRDVLQADINIIWEIERHLYILNIALKIIAEWLVDN